MKVVFHLNEMEKWGTVKGNIKNLLAIDATIDVNLVVNGPAIKGYFAPEQVDFIETTPSQLFACRHALNGHQLAEEDLPEKVVVVPAGVYALVELQNKGYSCIKI